MLAAGAPPATHDDLHGPRQRATNVLCIRTVVAALLHVYSLERVRLTITVWRYYAGGEREGS